MRPSGPVGKELSDEKLPEKDATFGGRLVVIGNFDGVHLGHQAVLLQAAEQAKQRGLGLCVLTFDPHPAVVLGRLARPVLTQVPRKRQLMQEVVPDIELVVQAFDQELASFSPEKFARDVLVGRLQARAVLVGENFRFGKGRVGDLGALRDLGSRLGFDAWAEALRGDEEGAFSSTRVRSLLKAGRVRKAARVLGRPHLLTGSVEQGEQRGRLLGYPTANLGGVIEALPLEGVYLVQVFEYSGAAPEYLALGVANLGRRPTVDSCSGVEVHLLDYSGDLYGKSLGLTLLRRIRATEKFADLEGLADQISLDVIRARALAREEQWSQTL